MFVTLKVKNVYSIARKVEKGFSYSENEEEDVFLIFKVGKICVLVS